MSPGTPADALAGLPSAQLGKYQLIRRLATGGMAELFLARATALHGFEKLVVLKRILPQHAESEDFIRMFLAEARLAATLHHPNIVQVYDIGGENGTYFFTMEYVQGQDLRRLVRAARKKAVPIPVEHVLHIVAGVAAGLNHAHEKHGRDGRPLGIVHRDVSPSNVLVTYEGGVKIVDFGIAKAATAQVNTIAGTLKGKIPYMSPEQCRGEAVDRRSDIFSIGTLLWEMTTGSRLFAGDNEFAILNRVAKGEVPLPSSVRPDYPPELEAIVMRALQADPNHRYETALDLQVDLEDFSREARLPVSSARMARFMRDLFSEEIEKAALQLAADSEGDDLTTQPQPVVAPTGMVTVSEPANEYTPSELRAHAALPTPGPAGSGTGMVAAPSSYGRVPGQTRPAVAVALVAGLLAVGGGGVAAYTMYGPDSDPPTADKAAVEPRVEIVEAPVQPPSDADEAIVVDDEDPEADPGGGDASPTPAGDGAVAAADAGGIDDPDAAADSPSPDDDGAAAPDDAGEPDVDGDGGEDADPDSAPIEKPKWTHKGGKGRRKGGGKSSKPAPKPDPEPEDKPPATTKGKKRPKDKDEPEPKYDPSSALPPM